MFRKMNKIIAIIMLICSITLLGNVKIKANEIVLTNDAKGAILIEPTTMNIIYQHESKKEMSPASLTKIMTMLLVCEALKNELITFDTMFVTSEYATSMGGTQVYLETGEEMSVEDLLKCVAIASANDACVVLAEGIYGSVENFVVKMNEKCKELGCTNTFFKNPHGLTEEGHYTCSYDMALMSAELINKYEDIIIKYTSTYEDYIRNESPNKFWLVNRNKLVKFVKGVDGLKTGWTNDAGYCIVSTMKKDDLRLISVIMGCSTPDLRMSESMKLLNYGMSNYEIEKIFNAGDIIETINNVNIKPNRYNIIVSKDVNILKKKTEKDKNITIEKNIDYNNPLFNNTIGNIKIFSEGKIIQEVELLVSEEIRRANFFEILFNVIKELFLISI